MEQSEAVDGLKALSHLDMDAVYAYNHALPHITLEDLRQRLIAFRQDHERHVVELAEMIRQLGSKPPSFGRDLKGIIMEGATVLLSATGTAGALKALRTNADITNRAYIEALALEMPAECRQLVEQMFSDAVSHKAYLQQVIDERVWDCATPQPLAPSRSGAGAPGDIEIK